MTFDVTVGDILPESLVGPLIRSLTKPLTGLLTGSDGSRWHLVGISE